MEVDKNDDTTDSYPFSDDLGVTEDYGGLFEGTGEDAFGTDERFEDDPSYGVDEDVDSLIRLQSSRQFNAFRLIYGLVAIVYLISLIIFYSTVYVYLDGKEDLTGTYGVILAWNWFKPLVCVVVLICLVDGRVPASRSMIFGVFVALVWVGSLMFLIAMLVDISSTANSPTKGYGDPGSSPLYCCVYFSENPKCPLDSGPCERSNLTDFFPNATAGNVTAQDLGINPNFVLAFWITFLIFLLELAILIMFVLIIRSITYEQGICGSIASNEVVWDSDTSSVVKMDVWYRQGGVANGNPSYPGHHHRMPTISGKQARYPGSRRINIAGNMYPRYPQRNTQKRWESHENDMSDLRERRQTSAQPVLYADMVASGALKDRLGSGKGDSKAKGNSQGKRCELCKFCYSLVTLLSYVYYILARLGTACSGYWSRTMTPEKIFKKQQQPISQQQQQQQQQYTRTRHSSQFIGTPYYENYQKETRINHPSLPEYGVPYEILDRQQPPPSSVDYEGYGGQPRPLNKTERLYLARAKKFKHR